MLICGSVLEKGLLWVASEMATICRPGDARFNAPFKAARRFFFGCPFGVRRRKSSCHRALDWSAPGTAAGRAPEVVGMNDVKFAPE